MASESSQNNDKSKKDSETVVLRVKGVTKSFRNKNILNDINIEIKSGEIFGIIGVSGAGKTTLLETMIGFLRPDQGDVLYRPKNLLVSQKESKVYKSVYKEKKEVRKLFGFSTQTPSFYDNLTVRENLLYFGSLYDIPGSVLENNIETSLRLVGLYSHRDVLAAHLSGGMQKRLDVACALIHNPEVLILDEPTADLDITSRKMMWDLVNKINSKGTSVIVSSHFLEEIEILCDRIALLHDRKIISIGTLEDIRKKYAKNEEIHLQTTPGDYKKIIKKLKQSKVPLNDIDLSGNMLVLYSDSADQILHHILHIVKNTREKIINVDLRKPPLSEVFESLTKNDKEDS